MSTDPQYDFIRISTSSSTGLTRQKTIFILIGLFWTLTITGSTIRDWYLRAEVRERMALIQAEALADKDLIVRLWNAQQGGVYVPPSPTTPPNPYLQIPNRDVITRDGQKLTLINPAYMTRQIHELQKKKLRAYGNLTSLKPINPHNTPDAWEKSALLRLQQGEKLVWSVEDIDGQPHMRLMRPLLTEDSCLKCHSAQGYQVGEVRGGLSTTVPMAPLVAAQANKLQGDIQHSLVLWLVGLIGLFTGYWWLSRGERGREKAVKLVRTLSRAVEHSPASVVITDAQGNIEYVNPKFQTITGYSFQEALGQNPRVLKSGHHPPEYYQNLWEIITAGREWTGEFYNKKKNGEYYWELASISPIKGPDGQITHFVAVKEDITLRKSIEHEMARQKEFVETVLNSIPVPISILDVRNYHVLGVNQAFLAKVGLPLDQVLGRPCHEILYRRSSPCDTEFEPCPLHQMQCQDGRCEVEQVHQAADGRKSYVEISVFPFRDEKGQTTQVVHMARDITLRKEAEEAMKAAKEAAEAASRTKSEFMANLSHEFRTPMNGIIGMTELALETELTRQQREYLEMIKESADSLHALLDDILDFSKIEAGRLDLEPVEFQLRESLSEAVHSVAYRAHHTGVELMMQVQPDVPDHLIGDPGRLRQIILNLLSNALKFTEKGEVVLEVLRESQQDRELELHFVVTDTGIGIPPEKHQLIFQAFTQADGSTTRKYGGTGLGLTIASRLVHMYNGRIWLESEVGKGSSFHFTARFGLVETPAYKAVPLIQEKLRGLSALIVDDNATARRIVSDTLRSWGMIPRVVANAGAALTTVHQAVAAGRPPNLIILDAQMPDMDGFELARQLNSTPESSGIPMILLTSGTNHGDEQRCQVVGINGYLPKPVRQSELLTVIKASLGQAASPASDTPKSLITRQTARMLRRKLRLLVVEDNLVNQKLAQALLVKNGHMVTVAANGRQGVAAWEKEKFDAILMDIMMPEMDGVQATALIREKEKITGGHIPIVAMTAYAMKGDQERFLSQGFDGYVAKPINPTDLFSQLEMIQLASLPVAEMSISRLAGMEDSSFDQEALLSRVGGDVDLALSMVSLFLEELPLRLTDISQAIRNGDPTQLSVAAHGLKGAIGYFSAPTASEATKSLEAMARSGNLAGADAAYQLLNQETKKLEKALAAWEQSVIHTKH